jgi:hypothetical protein
MAEAIKAVADNACWLSAFVVACGIAVAFARGKINIE